MSKSSYGLLAEYDSADTLLLAAERMQQEGYRQMEAYTPFPVEGLAEATGMKRTILPRVVLIGALTGLCIGFGMQYWISVIAYPINIGGRPLNSWPSFMPVTFEVTILCAALSAVLGMLALNGLPRPHHPLFAVEGFERATSDGYFLCIQSRDEQFRSETTRMLLDETNPVEVKVVPQI